jgi:hypothetical protein
MYVYPLLKESDKKKKTTPIHFKLGVLSLKSFYAKPHYSWFSKQQFH